MGEVTKKKNKIIIWALFDSGNGCYKKGMDELKKEKGIEAEIFSVGVDIENKNKHNFINLNLADNGQLFGNDKIFNELDKLPKPDLIIASPPCESWSVASAMKNGNACWKQEKVEDCLSATKIELSRFTIRNNRDYENYQFKFDKSFRKRINGELCIFNTIQIIKKYKPIFYIIENPAFGRIWDYITEVIGFELEFKNFVRYNNYDYPLQKPTRFSGNIDLDLDNKITKAKTNFNNFSRSYNDRSNIPLKLVKEIFEKTIKQIEELKQWEKS